jgi:hypothetical protein
MNRQRLLPLSGIAFVVLVLLLVIAIGGDTPGTDESVAQVVAFYDENEVRHFITAFAWAATVPFLLLFVVGLRAVMARADDPVWGDVAVAGAILAGGSILITAATHFALLDASTQDAVVEEAIVAVTFLEGSSWVAFNAAFGVMMLGAAGLFLSAGVMRWLGWIALALGIALFVPVADFVALLATLVWIVVVSALQLRAPRAAQAMSPAPAR